MPDTKYKAINYTFNNNIVMIRVVGLSEGITVKINNQTLLTYANCLCVYNNRTSVLYYNVYNNGVFQEYGYLNVNPLTKIYEIVLTHTNKNFINYSFPITITQFKIKNMGFNPDVKNPSPDNHWLIYVTHGIEPSDLSVFIGCRDATQSDQYWVFDNSAWPEYFFIARDEDGNIITHTGKRVPVYPSSTIKFNIDDNVIIPKNYDFSDIYFGSSKLFVNNCNPLVTFKSCTDRVWCRKLQLLDYKDPTKTPMPFIYDPCTGQPFNWTNNNGIVKDIVLKNNYFYGFTIQEHDSTETIISDYTLTKTHQLLHVNQTIFCNVKFNFIVNNGNLNIADVDAVKVELRGYCNSTENCTSNSDLFKKSWDDIREFLKDVLLQKLYIGKYNLKLWNKDTGQVILNEHYLFCGDNTIDVYFTYHDFQNYIDCKLALPYFPNQELDTLMVRSDSTVSYDQYLWYSIETWMPNPQNLLTLYPGDRCDNKMTLDWSKHEYYTLSASVRSTIEYFVQCEVQWWHEADYQAYHTTYGDIASTFNNHDTYITTRRPDDYKNDDYVVLRINRVADPYNNIKITGGEQYRIRGVNFYYGNKKIFSSPCLHETEECWFEFNGIPSYLWGISTEPIEEEMLSKVSVEKFTNNNFDGSQYGKASYEDVTIKIPCYVKIAGRPLITFEDNFEVIFREYLFNKRDRNGLLKNNYLKVSYSDRIYTGFISGAEDIKIDVEKGTGEFTLEFTVPAGIFYREYLKEWGVGDYRHLEFNQALLPVIWIIPEKNNTVLNLTITDNLTHERMIIAGFLLTGLDENSRLVVDCANKEIYYNRVRITDKVPFLYGWLELDSHYDLELSEGYSVDGIMGGKFKTDNY